MEYERLSRNDILDYAKHHGYRSAGYLLLLAGYDGFDGTYEEYNELMSYCEMQCLEQGE